MIRPEIFVALKVVYYGLKEKGVNWVLVGSLSLALQGVDIDPSDIDILTDREGAFEFNKLFKEYEVEGVNFGSSEFFESYFGKFNIGGVKIELMGDLKEKRDGEWFSFCGRLENFKIVEVEGMRLPVSSLGDQLESYSKSERDKDKIKASKIKQVFKQEIGF